MEERLYQSLSLNGIVDARFFSVGSEHMVAYVAAGNPSQILYFDPTSQQLQELQTLDNPHEDDQGLEVYSIDGSTYLIRAQFATSAEILGWDDELDHFSVVGSLDYASNGFDRPTYFRYCSVVDAGGSTANKLLGGSSLGTSPGATVFDYQGGSSPWIKSGNQPLTGNGNSYAGDCFSVSDSASNSYVILATGSGPAQVGSYHWDPVAGNFLLVQTLNLPTQTNSFVSYLQHFTIDNETFVAVADRGLPPSARQSIIFRWNGTFFESFQTIETNSVSSVEAFTIDTKSYLIWSSSDFNTGSSVYRWNPKMRQFDYLTSVPGDYLCWKYHTFNNSNWLFGCGSEVNSGFYYLFSD